MKKLLLVVLMFAFIAPASAKYVILPFDHGTCTSDDFTRHMCREYDVNCALHTYKAHLERGGTLENYKWEKYNAITGERLSRQRL